MAANETKLETKTETTKIRIVVTSSFGVCSRGRHSARIGSGASAIWAPKDANGSLVIEQAGVWQLHCSDGFSRQARATLEVRENGDWVMFGETRRFDVV